MAMEHNRQNWPRVVMMEVCYDYILHSTWNTLTVSKWCALCTTGRKYYLCNCSRKCCNQGGLEGDRGNSKFAETRHIFGPAAHKGLTKMGIEENKMEITWDPGITNQDTRVKIPPFFQYSRRKLLTWLVTIWLKWIILFYHLHFNNVTHLEGGVADDAVW